MQTSPFAVILAFASLVALPASGQDMMALRPEAVVTADVVRLGDLVTGAGDKAGIPLFRAPDLGRIGAIRVENIRAAAAELGLELTHPHAVSSISVTRRALEWSPADLAAHIRTAVLKIDASLADAAVEFDTPPPPLVLAGQPELFVNLPFFDIESGRFRVEIAQENAAAIVVTGQVQSRLIVPVLTRTISRGDVVTSADYVMERRARRALPSGIVNDPALLAGLVARRILRPGLIRADDMTGRDLVERHQKVTVLYNQPGLNLTMTGKALGAGQQGAVVQVLNLASKRTFDAVVTGVGTVSAKIH